MLTAAVLTVLASAMTDPDRGGATGGTLVLVAAAIVAIAGLCLFLFFRRGSIADRARTDALDRDELPRAHEARDARDASDDLSP